MADDVTPPVSVGELVERLNPEIIDIHGTIDRVIERPARLDETQPTRSLGVVAFCGVGGAAGAAAVVKSSAQVVVVGLDVLAICRREGCNEKTLLATHRPRRTFIRIVNLYFSQARPKGIHPAAVVEPHVAIGTDVYVGPFAYVAASHVGDGCVIHGHVHIYPDTYIGRNVEIHAGTIIGADGFGYERGHNGALEKFPHLGDVIIDDDVEIGANACIDRGTLGSTIIREGAKIDNLVYIAHNVTVGRHAAVIALAAIAGSSDVGELSWIGPAAVVRDKVSIGVEALVGMGAVVVDDVPDGVTVVGVPARPFRDAALSGARKDSD